MDRLTNRMLFGLLLLAMALPVVWPDDKAPQESEEPKKEKAKDKSESDKSEKDKSEYPPFEEVVKGMEEKPGFFHLYQKEEKLYASIKADQLKQPFWLAITLSGGIFAGMQWDDMLCFWELQGNKLLLVRPDVRHQAPQTTFKEVVERTFPATILRSAPILTKSPDGGYVIDFSLFFKSDLAGLSPVAEFLLDAHASLNPDLSSWAKVKAFPHNVELSVDAAFTGPRVGNAANWTDYTDPGRSTTMLVHYSLAHMPETDYKPRPADTRVGFFHTAVKDFSKKYDTRSRFVRNIHRWDLQKADPSLEISPPQKPIIFYIEKSVPYRFRRYVREGILEWNKAFEKIGFVDAMVVRQQTDTEFNDLDPEDVRYNFIRWTTHDMGFAAGPSRVNPLTGQILDADIIFDDSMLRYDADAHETFNQTAALCHNDQKFLEMMQKFTGMEGLKNLGNLPKELHAPKTRAMAHFMELFSKRGRPLCMVGYGMKQQLALAHMMFDVPGKNRLPEEFVGEAVREIVMHEVGHTLGLFHNFKASSWLPLSQINSAQKPLATSGSVMDYHPINFAPKDKDVVQGHYLPCTIGPYDHWAIEYGYRPVGDKDTEADMLANIVKRVAENGLAYGNDFYASLIDPDPMLVQWDLGDDQLAYAKQRTKLVDQLMKTLVDRMADAGEDFSTVRRGLDALFFEYGYVSWLAARYVGGESLYWDHKGDPNYRPPFVVVPAARQKEALQYLADTVFSDQQYRLSPELLNHLAPGTWWHWESDNMSVWAEYPFHERVLSLQMITFVVLLNPVNLNRLHNLPLQVAADQEAFTIADLLDGLTRAMWAELSTAVDGQKWDARHPYISSTRRNLQRLYLNIWTYYFILEYTVMLVPEDARTMARSNLVYLQNQLKSVLDKQDLLDRASKAHLLESAARIDQALQAKFVK